MLENSSSNPSQEVFRLLLSMLARHFGWTAMVLDISCAFLNALLDEKFLIRPPPVLARLGLLFPNTLWLALRAIYGLRKSPKLWEEERNKTLNNRVLHLSTGTVIMETIETGTWILKSENECVGLFMMYVDDGLVVAKPELLKTLGVELKSLWALKFQGVLCGGGLADGDTLTIDDVTLPVQKELNFLGMKIRRSPDGGLLLHQTPWLVQELTKRGWLHMKGSPSLPTVPEGTIEPMPRDGSFSDTLRQAQGEIGCLQWLALRTRPDVAATVGSIACISALHPGLALKLCQGVWRYLSATRQHGIFFEAVAGGDRPSDALWCFGDASLAPGASRSRTGVVVKWGPHVLAWKSQRQSLTAWSAFFQTGIPVKVMLEKLIGESAETYLGDNAACIVNLLKGTDATVPTRTRHFGIRCSYLRDHAKSEGVEIYGSDIPADALTKVLSRCKLAESRLKLNVVKALAEDSNSLLRPCRALRMSVCARLISQAILLRWQDFWR